MELFSDDKDDTLPQSMEDIPEGMKPMMTLAMRSYVQGQYDLARLMEETYQRVDAPLSPGQKDGIEATIDTLYHMAMNSADSARGRGVNLEGVKTYGHK